MSAAAQGVTPPRVRVLVERKSLLAVCFKRDISHIPLGNMNVTEHFLHNVIFHGNVIFLCVAKIPSVSPNSFDLKQNTSHHEAY